MRELHEGLLIKGNTTFGEENRDNIKSLYHRDVANGQESFQETIKPFLFNNLLANNVSIYI